MPETLEKENTCADSLSGSFLSASSSNEAENGRLEPEIPYPDPSGGISIDLSAIHSAAATLAFPFGKIWREVERDRSGALRALWGIRRGWELGSRKK
jgi:hypothetical protein